MSSVDPNYDLVAAAFTAIWGRYARVGFSYLSEIERVIFCTWQFVCEVNNGGMHQFFKNPSGEFAVETLSALEDVEMPYAASLLCRALVAFPNPSKVQDVRLQQLLSLPSWVQHDLFDELTRDFFDSSEDAYGLQADYVRRNRNSLAKH